MTAPVLEGKGLIELLSKAVVDPAFQTELFANRVAYAKEYGLSTNDTIALEKIDAAEFAQASAAGGHNASASWAVGAAITGHFKANV